MLKDPFLHPISPWIIKSFVSSPCGIVRKKWCGVGLHCTWEDLLNTQVDQKDLRLPNCCQQVYKYMIFDPPSGGLANQKEWVAQSRN